MKTFSVQLSTCYLWLLLLFAFGCTKDVLLIRIENDSISMFNQVRINPDDNETMFGDLAPGETSAFKPFEKAYRYAQVKLVIEGKEYILQPIDYVGETPLENGKYTYIIGVGDLESPYGLTIDLRED